MSNAIDKENNVFFYHFSRISWNYHSWLVNYTEIFALFIKLSLYLKINKLFILICWYYRFKQSESM